MDPVLGIILVLCVLVGTFFGLGFVYALRALDGYLYVRNLVKSLEINHDRND